MTRAPFLEEKRVLPDPRGKGKVQLFGRSAEARRESARGARRDGNVEGLFRVDEEEPLEPGSIVQLVRHGKDHLALPVQGGRRPRSPRRAREA